MVIFGKSMLGRSVGVLIALLFCIGTAQAQYPFAVTPIARSICTYYVSPSGSDANNGTSQATPWQTIAKVNAQTLSAGQIVCFLGGWTYSGAITVNQGGTAANPVIIGSYGFNKAIILSGSSPCVTVTNVGGVVVDGLNCQGAGNLVTSSHGVSVVNSLAGNVLLNYVQIINSVISGYGGNGIDVRGTNGTSGFSNVTIANNVVHDTTGSRNAESACIFVRSTPGRGQGITQPAFTNLTIQNNNVYNCIGMAAVSAQTGTGIFFGETSVATIQNNETHDSGSAGTFCGGPSGIWTEDGTSITMQFNEAYNITVGAGGCDGDGFDFDCGITNSIMQFNYAHDNAQTGFLVDSCGPGPLPNWGNNHYRYNISQNNKGNEWQLSAQGATTGPLYFYNNTLYNALGKDIFHASLPGSLTNGYFANNIAYSVGGNLTNINPVGTYTFTRNNWFGSGSQFVWNGTTYATMALWQTATNQEKLNGVNVGLTSDPRINNNGGLGTVHGYAPTISYAYQLQAGSPMSQAGLDLRSQLSINVGTQDFFGTAIPDGSGKFNVGAGAIAAPSCSQIENAFYNNAVNNGGQPLSAARKALYHTMICSMVSSGVWSKMDALYIFAAPDRITAKTNLVSANFLLTENVGGTTSPPSFQPDQGFQGNRVINGPYLALNYNPATFGGQLTAASAHVATWIVTAGTGGSTWGVGTSGSDPPGEGYLLPGGTNLQGQLNSVGNEFPQQPSGGVTTGDQALSRATSTTLAFYINAGLLGTSTVGAGALLNQSNTRWLGDLQGNDYFNGVLGEADIGSGFSTTDMTNSYNAKHTFLQAVAGVP